MSRTCVLSDQTAFKACKNRIEQLVEQGELNLSVRELKTARVDVKRRGIKKLDVRYLVVTIAIDGWGKLRFVCFNSGGAAVVRGYGPEAPIPVCAEIFLDGPRTADICPICSEKRGLLQECNPNGTPVMPQRRRCWECKNLTRDDPMSPVFQPS